MASCSKTDEVSLDGPAFLVVWQEEVEGSHQLVEHASICPFPQITSEEKVNELMNSGFAPTLESAADKSGRRIISWNIIKLTSQDQTTSRFRVNVLRNGVVHVIDNVEYHGEEYLPVAYGDIWYVAIKRW